MSPLEHIDMEVSLKVRNCRQHGARERSIDSQWTVMRMRRYRAGEKDGRLRIYTSLSLAPVRTRLPLSRDVGDSFEDRKHKAMRPPCISALREMFAT